MLEFLKHRFHPFAHVSFRFFFFAQLFSAIGTWSHELARSWIVLDMAGTTTALGTLLLTMALPGLFLTLHGGALADRVDARKLFFITKTTLALSAFALFVIVEFYEVKLWMIYGFALIEGFVNSVDGPAFTAIFARTLPRSDFQQGLAIHSTSFHVSRMLGPAVAGLLMAWKGPGYVFLFDGLSYIAVLYMIMHIKLRDKNLTVTTMPGEPGQKSPNSLGGLLSGLKFFVNTPMKRYKQLQMFASIVIIIPLISIVFRSYLKDKFNLNADEFGYLFTSPAMGAMTGAVFFTLAAFKKPIRNLIYGVPSVCVTLFLLPLANNPQAAAALLALIGFFSYLNVASITQSMHLETPDDYRGRLGSLITLGFNSVGPLMSWPIGVYTDKFGYEASIYHLTLLFGVLSLVLGVANFRRQRSTASV